MEKEICFAWYRLRGLGLVCLCSFVFFFGAYLANQRNIAVNGSAGAQTMPVACAQREDHAIALSFDVTRGSGSVGTLLDILKRYETKATFFVTAGWADAYPEEAKRIVNEGHDIGSRGTDCESMTGKSSKEIHEILEETSGKVQKLTGSRIKLFRAPYGEYDSALTRAVVAEGLVPIRWSVDSEDWKDYGIESILEKVTQDGRPGAGAIVRLHGGAEYTAQVLERMIDSLRQQGYVLMSVSQLIKK